MLRRFIVISIFMLLLTPTLHAQESLTHVVQPGENLFRIALRYGVSMDDLARTNAIADARRIYAGQVLTIPGLTNPATSAAEVVANPLVATAPTVHVIQRGETLKTIAAKYGVTMEQILEANNIANPDRIYAGQTLNIWASQPSPSAVATDPAVEPSASLPEQSTTYIVQPGDHLSQIARQYGVSWTVLASANGITNPDRIYAGMELIIPGASQINDLGIIAPIASASAPAPKVGVGREIIVDLSDSTIYAYEDGQLVRSVIVSTGLPETPTVVGNFAVYRKLDSQTMSGPGYYLPGVPWVMYFYSGYAIHGTYWHNNFGRPMSHGCVNLPTPEAQWFYNFADIGTPVNVQF